jgi:hypothetical protein
MLRALLCVLLGWCTLCAFGSTTLIAEEPDQKPVDKKLQKLADDSRSRAKSIKVGERDGW